MTPIADMVAELGAKGVSIDAIVVAVRALELSLFVGTMSADSLRTGADKRRERDRLAKREKRAKSALLRQQASPSAAAVVVDASADMSADKADNAPLTILPSYISQRLPKEESKGLVQSTEPRARPKRGMRLPDDWQPTETDRQYAAGRGLRPADIEIEATKFRNYWTNRTDRHASKPLWDRAWVNWILNIKGPNNGSGRSVVAAQDRLNAKLAEFSEPDLLGGARGEARPPHVRLLPSRRSG